MSERSIIFIAWGQPYISAVRACIEESLLPAYPLLLITDAESDVTCLPSAVRVVRYDFVLSRKERKLEALTVLPANLETVLFLDVDTRVVDDVSLGFDQAERHGIAIAPAPHYSLADFRTFGPVMERAGVAPRGQLIYNSGVVFFAWNRSDVRDVFALALELARKESDAPYGDQSFLTLAMELLGFNPYTLSPSFNHRGFGELISGSIRVWHSNDPVPPGAAETDPGWLRRYERPHLVRHLRVPR